MPSETNSRDDTERDPDEWGTHGLEIESGEDFEALRDLVAADMERLGNRVERPLRMEVDIRVYDRQTELPGSEEDETDV